MSETTKTLDDEIRALLEAGEHERAAVLVLETHGPGIYRMFLGVFHDEAVAQDLYQRFSIEVWKSIGSFAGRSAVYTWAYVIARRTVTWHLRRPARKREQALATPHEHLLLVEHLSRSMTPAWRRTETKHRFQELCAGLPNDERMLVMLRIGERMDWKQIARVLDEEGALADDEALAREAARLRKRFERVKDKLRTALT
ncbi:MAG: RNA polymerase sigma factor [Sandaracinus sp.]|nr:RNA polymerase sigma factor [Sandaracinus sp.]